MQTYGRGLVPGVYSNGLYIDGKGRHYCVFCSSAIFDMDDIARDSEDLSAIFEEVKEDLRSAGKLRRP
jgi:hypothetical protein